VPGPGGWSFRRGSGLVGPPSVELLFATGEPVPSQKDGTRQTTESSSSWVPHCGYATSAASGSSHSTTAEPVQIQPRCGPTHWSFGGCVRPVRHFPAAHSTIPDRPREYLAMFLSHLVQSRSAVGKEKHLALDKIMVFVLAMAFFGGLVFLALKGRRDKTGESRSSASPTQDAADAGALPIQPRDRERPKIRK
jgi:hypothetical protein